MSALASDLKVGPGEADGCISRWRAPVSERFCILPKPAKEGNREKTGQLKGADNAAAFAGNGDIMNLELDVDRAHSCSSKRG